MTTPLPMEETDILIKKKRCPKCGGAEFLAEMGPYGVMHKACTGCKAAYRIVAAYHVRLTEWAPSEKAVLETD